MRQQWMIGFATTAAIGAALALLFAGGTYELRLGTILAMYISLASAWNLIGGMAGYPSFATAAFFGLGAYAGALTQVKGIPMVFAWTLAGLVAAIAALAIGWIVLRLRGHYFAIASFAVVIVLREIATNWTGLTGGGMGVSLPMLQSSMLAQARLFFTAQAMLAAIAVAISWLVACSKLGFALGCIRQNESAAGMLGLDARRAKAAAFCISSAVIGAAGAIYASSIFYIDSSDVFDILLSVKPIIMAMLGGAGTVAGPIVGAALFMILEQTVWANFLSVHSAILGALVVAIAMFLPRGLFGRRFLRRLA
jgi:branched-chain amino acid transport system permease protein